MHRMVGILLTFTNNHGPASEPTRHPSQDLHQLLSRQMKRARGGDQQATRCEDLHSKSVQPSVRLETLWRILLATNKGRRIRHHDVKTLSGRPQSSQALEYVHTLSPDTFGHAIERCMVAYLLKRRGRCIHAQHLPSPGHRRLYPPRTGIGEKIEHPSPLTSRDETAPIRPMIEKPAGFLA